MTTTDDEITKLPIATDAEWAEFLESDGFYTAPEFLAEKFVLKTGKRPPSSKLNNGENRNTLDEISKVFDEVRDLVLAKNKQYGDSVLDPVRIFSQAPLHEQILVRLDDKMSRLARGNDSIEADEDIFKDIMGYCAFAIIALNRRTE